MKRLSLCVILSLCLCWGCGDPPNSVMEMVLPDKDMPAAEEPPPPVTTIADAKTPPAQVVPVTEKEEPPVTVAAEEEEPPPPAEPSLVMKMETILATEGEVLSPIPDAVYELLWGNWTKAGSLEPRRHYTRYIDADGIAIVGSDNVEERTFQLARHIVLIMTSKLPGLREALAVTTPDPNNATERFRLVLFTPGVETPADMPEIQQGGEFIGGAFAYPMAITPLEAGKPYTPAVSKTLVHEMAHAIDYALTFHTHVLPNFAKRLETAWDRQQEHFRLREGDERPFSELQKIYPICHAKDSYNNVSMLEWWATFVDNDWFDEFFEPWMLQLAPNYEHLEREKVHCGDIVNLADEIFPRYAIREMVSHRYAD